MTDNSRLEQKEKNINNEIESLNSKVKQFTNFAWVFVALGFLVIIGGFIFGDFEKFSEFGDFIGGSVGSIWSLAGLLFVYVAFLGQKQSILNQQIEILYNQEELRATRKELAGQKKQMELQNATLKQQQFENTFFQLFEHYTRYVDNNKDAIFQFWSGCFILSKHEEVLSYCKNKSIRDIGSVEVRNLEAILNTIFDFINNNEIINKAFYYNLVISQSHGDLLLTYYCFLKNKNSERLQVFPFLNQYGNYTLLACGNKHRSLR